MTPARVERDTLYAVVDGGDPVLIDVAPLYFNSRLVRAVWTGSDFLVIWTRGREIAGARIATDGSLRDGPHVIAEADGIDDIAIGAAASQALVVYQAGGAAKGVRLDNDGARPTADITTLADRHFDATSFSIASDGTNFFVSWINKSRGGVPNDWIAGRIVDANGNVATALSGYSTGDDFKQAAVAFWTGSNYLIVWSRAASSDLWAARVDTQGHLIDYPPVRVGAVNGVVSSIARAASGQLLVAYGRNGRALARFVVPARQRAAIHR